MLCEKGGRSCKCPSTSVPSQSDVSSGFWSRGAPQEQGLRSKPCETQGAHETKHGPGSYEGARWPNSDLWSLVLTSLSSPSFDTVMEKDTRKTTFLGYLSASSWWEPQSCSRKETARRRTVLQPCSKSKSQPSKRQLFTVKEEIRAAQRPVPALSKKLPGPGQQNWEQWKSDSL